MAQYVRFTMPKAEAEALRLELRMIRAPDLQMTEGQRAKLIQRLDAAIGGRDLRVTNRHNTPKPAGKRMGYLDVRRTA